MNHTKKQPKAVNKTHKRSMATQKKVAKKAPHHVAAKAAPHTAQVNTMMTTTTKAAKRTTTATTAATAAFLPTFLAPSAQSMFTPFGAPSALNTPFTMAKRTLIHKPKAPLDNDTELRMDFNVLKAAEPIAELEDDQYPEWIWTVADLQPSLYELSKVPENEMTIEQVRRKFKLDRREIIKGNNTSARK